jgi:hypothetical protein
MAIGILRMGVGRSGLDLRKSMREILSDIFYRIHYCNVAMSNSTSIIGKITVRINADAMRAHRGNGG